MSNSASSNIEDFADLISGHGADTPVNNNLVSLLRSLASMTDSELAAAKITTKVRVWNSLNHGYDEAFELPEGTLVADIFQIDINPSELKNAVDFLKANPNGSFWEAATQAEIIRKAFPDTYR